jgi:NADH dehydrogenase
MVRTMPAIPLVGMGEHPFQPVWHEDLGEALARAVINPEPVRQALDLAGPEVTNTREILERLEALTDMHPVHLPVPELLTRLGARAAETVGLDLPIKEDQVTMLVEGNLIPPGQPNALTDVFGVQPLGLDAGLRKLVDALPEALPSDGTGKLERQSYWADIRGSRMSPDEIFDMLRREFYTLPPEGLVKVGVEPGSPLILDEGETLTLALPMRGHIQVRVAEARNRVITLLTVEGHPLSGAIRFMVEEREGGIIRFEIRSFTRASNLLDLMAMRTAGFLAQKANWRAVVARVAERSGGEPIDGVNDETGFLNEEDAHGVEKWVDELVVGLRRAEAPSLGEDT